MQIALWVRFIYLRKRWIMGKWQRFGGVVCYWTLVYLWMMHCCRHLFMVTIANSSEPLILEVFRNGLKEFKVLTWPWTYPIPSVICGMCWNVHPSIFFCIPMPALRGLLPKQKGPTFPQPPPPVYPEEHRWSLQRVLHLNSTSPCWNSKSVSLKPLSFQVITGMS